MHPAPPASASSAVKRSTPYRSIGFQYVMTRIGTPVASWASRTVRITSAIFTPPRRAMSSAVWMTGPSSTGSLCGSPTSTMSAPPATTAFTASIPPSTVGNPAGRYAMRAARFSAFACARAEPNSSTLPLTW